MTTKRLPPRAARADIHAFVADAERAAGRAAAPVPAPAAAMTATPKQGACVELNHFLSALSRTDAALLAAEAERQDQIGAELAARGLHEAAEECACRMTIMATAAALAASRKR